MNEPDKWLTIDEASEYIGRPVATLRDWRQKGKGPRFFRVEGGPLHCTEAELKRWKAEQEASAGYPQAVAQ